MSPRMGNSGAGKTTTTALKFWTGPLKRVAASGKCTEAKTHLPQKDSDPLIQLERLWFSWPECGCPEEFSRVLLRSSMVSRSTTSNEGFEDVTLDFVGPIGEQERPLLPTCSPSRCRFPLFPWEHWRMAQRQKTRGFPRFAMPDAWDLPGNRTATAWTSLNPKRQARPVAAFPGRHIGSEHPKEATGTGMWFFNTHVVQPHGLLKGGRLFFGFFLVLSRRKPNWDVFFADTNKDWCCSTLWVPNVLEAEL